MEKSIRDNDYVLMICTPKYKARSDNRQGGVGYEGSIITSELFTQQNEKKFIPILRKGDWLDAMPTAYQGKRGLDLRDSPSFDAEYEELRQTLLGIREPLPPIREAKGIKGSFPKKFPLFVILSCLLFAVGGIWFFALSTDQPSTDPIQNPTPAKPAIPEIDRDSGGDVGREQTGNSKGYSENESEKRRPFVPGEAPVGSATLSSPEIVRSEASTRGIQQSIANLVRSDGESIIFDPSSTLPDACTRGAVALFNGGGGGENKIPVDCVNGRLAFHPLNLPRWRDRINPNTTHCLTFALRDGLAIQFSPTNGGDGQIITPEGYIGFRIDVPVEDPKPTVVLTNEPGRNGTNPCNL
jgi:hypothetical protein